MSGGHYDYIDGRLANVAEHINEDLDDPEGYLTCDASKEVRAKFEEMERMLRVASKLIRHCDYFMSGDIGDDEFTKRWDSSISDVHTKINPANSE